ncbi:hypothetical protein [Streptomyces sp. NPDC050485]|uniref:hypothetical protein n=1 Tax=Streptomyces sp. NPDC050485 TaxID=3365617 RepID=UPI003793F7AD
MFSGWIFRKAVDRARLLPQSQRLELAARLLVPRTDPPEPLTAVTPLSWQETADGIEKAARLLDDAALSLRPVAGLYLDVSDLTASVEQTAHEVREASTLLTEVYGDGEHLVDQALVPRFMPDPDQLRLARQAGERAALVAALARRSVPGDGEGVWSATWRADGTVEARWPGWLVRGWAALPEAVPHLLLPFQEYGRPPARVELEAEAPEPGWPAGGVPELERAERRAAFYDQPGRLADVIDQITRLQGAWPKDEIAERVRQAAAELHQRAPMCPHMRFRVDDPAWAMADSAGWVRCEAIVEMGDPVWGQFQRAGTDRGPVWAPTAAQELLAQAPDTLAEFLLHHLGQKPSVRLRAIPGPAGPIYTLGGDGIHRTHLFRILGLPWIFARVSADPLPREVDAITMVARTDPADLKPTAARWQRLLERGLVTGRLGERYSNAVLTLDAAPAPWLLAAPRVAAAYHRAYERIYPGSLAPLGIPSQAVENEEAWRRWLDEPSPGP